MAPVPTPTPDVVGQTFDEATAILAAEGLAIEATAEQYSETVPAGSVLTTDPGPGEGIAASGTVAPSPAGPERYAVPDVRGSTPKEATEAIVSAGLASGVGWRPSTTKSPPDRSPDRSRDRRSGASGYRGSDRFKGPEPVELPDITGKKQGVAIKRLEEAGVQVSAEGVFDSVAQGRVVSMSPKAATVVDSGSTVRDRGVQGSTSGGSAGLDRHASGQCRRAEPERLGLVAEIDDGEVTFESRLRSVAVTGRASSPRNNSDFAHHLIRAHHQRHPSRMLRSRRN